MHNKLAAFCFALLLASGAMELLADPPAHAPAHGWRKKHDPMYVGYSGRNWEHDYEIASGRCNREEIGAVLGGVAGGVIGSRVSSPENRTVAIIIGAAAGALIGAKIGRELDEADRGCFGHALELARPGTTVAWDNRASGVSYVLSPGTVTRDARGTCRDFTLVARTAGGEARRSGKACQSSAGVWEIL
ncbi:MAG TPA: RT0821/Lpp0805 family surface protein [Steroidobacteraceae bacterium]